MPLPLPLLPSIFSGFLSEIIPVGSTVKQYTFYFLRVTLTTSHCDCDAAHHSADLASVTPSPHSYHTDTLATPPTTRSHTRPQRLP